MIRIEISDSDRNSYEVFAVSCITPVSFCTKNVDNQWLAEVNVREMLHQAKADTGAEVSVMLKDTLSSLKVTELSHSTAKLSGYLAYWY